MPRFCDSNRSWSLLLPDCYKDKLIDEQERAIDCVKENLTKALRNRDVKGIGSWLDNYQQLNEYKIRLSDQDRDDFFTLLYEIVHSKYIDSEHRGDAALCCGILLRKRPYFDKVIDWKPLFDLYLDTAFTPNRCYHREGSDDLLFGLSFLIEKARIFFDPNEISRIVSHIRPFCCPYCDGFYKFFGLLNLFVPEKTIIPNQRAFLIRMRDTHSDVPLLSDSDDPKPLYAKVTHDLYAGIIEDVVSQWKDVSSFAIDLMAFELFSRLASQRPDISWSSYLPWLAEVAIVSLRIPVICDVETGKSAGTKINATRTRTPSCAKVFRTNDGSSKICRRTSLIAKFFVYAIRDASPDCALELLKRTFRLIEPFYHPSSDGGKLPPISLAQFISSLSAQFASRVARNEEGPLKSKEDLHRLHEPFQPLSEELICSFVDVVKPMLMNGLFWTRSAMRNGCVSGIFSLSAIRPKLLVAQVMEKALEGLAAVVETHLVKSSIEMLSLLIHVIFNPSVYPTGKDEFLDEFLMLTMNCIEANNCSQSMAVFALYRDALNYFEINENEGVDWAFGLVDKVFEVFEKSDAPEEDPEDVISIVSDMLDHLFMAMVPEVYRSVSQRIAVLLNEKTFLNERKEILILVRSWSRSNPKVCLKTLLDGWVFRQLFADDACLDVKSLSKLWTPYCVMLISGSMRFAGDDILLYSPRIVNMVNSLLATLFVKMSHCEDSSELTVLYSTLRAVSKMIRDICRGLLECYPLDEIRRGDRKCGNEMTIEWHVPTEEGMVFCSRLLKIIQTFAGDVTEFSTMPKTNPVDFLLRSRLYLVKTLVRVSPLIWSLDTETIPGSNRKAFQVPLISGMVAISGVPSDPGAPFAVQEDTVEKPGSLVTREEITKQLYGILDSVCDQRSVDVSVIKSVLKLIYLHFNKSPIDYNDAVRYANRVSNLVAFNGFWPFCTRYVYRSSVVKRAYSVHLRRMSSHFGMGFGESGKGIAKKVLDLFFYPYVDSVRELCQSCWSLIIQAHRGLYKVGLEKAMTAMEGEEIGIETVKGAISLLSSRGMSVLCFSSMKRSQAIFETLMSVMNKVDDDKVSSQLDGYGMVMLVLYNASSHFPYEDLKYEGGPQVIIDYLKRKASESAVDYFSFTNAMSSIISRSGGHWKVPLLTVAMLNHLILPSLPYNTELFGVLLLLLPKSLPAVHDHILTAINRLLYVTKEKYFKREFIVEGITPLDFEQEVAKESCSLYFDKLNFGFSSGSLLTYDYSGSVEDSYVFPPECENTLNKRSACDLILDMFKTKEEVLSVFGFMLLSSSRDVEDFNFTRATFWKSIFRLVGSLGDYDAAKSFILLCLDAFCLEMEGSEEPSIQKSIAEMVCGLVRASKHFDFSFCHDRVKSIIFNCLSLSSADSVTYWVACCHRAVIDIDPRRIRWFVDFLFEIVSVSVTPTEGESSRDFSSQVVKRLKVIGPVIAELNWKGFFWTRRLLTSFTSEEQLEDDLDLCRMLKGQIIGRLLTDLSVKDKNGIWCHLPETYKMLDLFINIFKEWNVKKQFLQSPENAIDLRNYTNRVLTCLFALKRSSLRGGVSLLRNVVPYFITSLFSLFDFPDAEIKETLCSVVTNFSTCRFDGKRLAELCSTFHKLIDPIESTSWRSRASSALWIRSVVLVHIQTIDMSLALENVLLCSRDPTADVRIIASESLTSLIRIVDPVMSEGVRVRLMKGNRHAFVANDTISAQQLDDEAHGAILALGAVILSYPFTIPTWMPGVLLAVAEKTASRVPVVAQTARKTFLSFWRTHQDSWSRDRLSFTPEQLDILMDLIISPHYYV